MWWSCMAAAVGPASLSEHVYQVVRNQRPNEFRDALVAHLPQCIFRKDCAGRSNVRVEEILHVDEAHGLPALVDDRHLVDVVFFHQAIRFGVNVNGGFIFVGYK